MEEKFSSWENSKIVVLPVAYDLTTSYKPGTIDGAVDVTKLINCLGERVPQNVISCIVSEEVDMRDKDKNVSDCIMTIKRDNKNALLKDIQSRIHVAQKSGYEQEEKRLVGEFNQLIKRGL